jgi:hypothetical protein
MPPEAGLRRELSRTAWEPGPLVSRQKLVLHRDFNITCALGLSPGRLQCAIRPNTARGRAFSLVSRGGSKITL